MLFFFKNDLFLKLIQQKLIKIDKIENNTKRIYHFEID